jgi:hypothetical protein
VFFSLADCPGTWTTRPGFEDESGTGGLSTEEKYLCEVSSFELMPEKCTYMAVTADSIFAAADLAKSILSNYALDMTNFNVHDPDGDVGTGNWNVFTLSLTTAEFNTLQAASNSPFLYVQPIMHNLKISPMVAAAENNADVRVSANGDVSASQLAAAVQTFIDENSALCPACSVVAISDFSNSDLATNEVVVKGGTGASSFVAALVVDHAATGLITKVTADLPRRAYNTEANWILQSGNRTNDHTPFWDRNIKGQGLTVGVGDSGLDHTSCFFRDSSRAVTFPSSGFDSITGKPVWENTKHRKVVQYVAYADNEEGENGGHGTHVAGTVAGSTDQLANDNGMAPSAKLAFFDIGFAGQPYLDVPGDLATQMFPYAARVGARIHSNSWGSDSNSYTGDARQTDQYSYDNQDFLVLVAAGNSGTDEAGNQVSGSLGAPATAKNCVSVGATQNGDDANDLAYFTSRGPSWDGRIKPDIVAPGYFITSANSKDTQPSGGHCSVTQMAGTSMATPAVAGTIALGQQYFQDGWYPSGKKNSGDGFKPMGALLKAVLINSGQRLSGSMANWQNSGNNAGQFNNYPNYDQGHGIVELDATLNFADARAGQGLFVRGDFGNMPTFTSTADAPVEHTFKSTGTDCVDSTPKEFRATLVWHDPPASGTSSRSLVNDLDILVTGSDGTTYYPNGRTSRDSKNNAESVVFLPTKGVEYTVKINANSLSKEQPYAYVVSGCFASPDRSASSGGAFPTEIVLGVVGGLAGIAALAAIGFFIMQMLSSRRSMPKRARPVAAKKKVAGRAGGSFTSSVGLTSGAGFGGLAKKANANRPAGKSLAGMNKMSKPPSTKKIYGKTPASTFNSKKWNDLV